MRTAKLICFITVMTMQAVTAQANPSTQSTRDLSVRWATYYGISYGVPVDLVMAIIDEESGWNPSAISDKGAVGLMQLMPQTAARFGVRNRFQSEENIRGGVAYLAWLNREFAGDLRLITAAYYVGESPILVRGLAYSSPDVQAYVRRVAQRYRARRSRAWRSGTKEQGDRR